MNLNALAVRAAADEQALQELIEIQEHAILAVASKVSKRYITKSDDEWSVSLCAFTKAVKTYDFGKGAFSSYSALLIRRGLIDYFRSESRFSEEVDAVPSAFEGSADEEDAAMQAKIQYAVARDSLMRGSTEVREEILDLDEALQGYGFGFFALTEASPKQEKTRRDCGKAVGCLLRSKVNLEQALRTGQLPMTALSRECGVSKKTLDRHRKYILAALVILIGDYPILSDYLKDVRKEVRK